MDRFESMSTLLAAVEAGSLSAAARRLGMPLATVSRKVSELEAHLGTRLLLRSSRQLMLTDAGRSYVAACKRILSDIDEAEREAAGEYRAPKGELVISAPIVFGRMHAVPVLSEFLRNHPDIDVRLLLMDRVANLVEDHVDVALRIGELPDSSLIATPLGTVQRVVCGSQRYFDARGTPKKPQDLSQHDCVTFDGLSSPHTWIFKQGKSEVRVGVRSRFTVNTAEAAIDAAIASLGVTRVLSYQIAEAEQRGVLVRVLRAFEPAAQPIHFVFGGQAPQPIKLRAFLDFAVPRLKARLGKLAPR